MPQQYAQGLGPEGWSGPAPKYGFTEGGRGITGGNLNDFGRQGLLPAQLAQAFGYGGGGGAQAGGGAGGAGGGGTAGPGGAGGTGGPGGAGQMAQGMWDVAQGYMDPDSDMFQQLLQRQRQAMGKDTAARQRSAAMAGAESGFGGGASPEMMQMQQMYGAQGQEALGQGMANLQLAAPQMGLQYGQAAMGGQMGQQAQNIGVDQFGRSLQNQQQQFGQTMQEGQRQYDVNTGMQQQGMTNQAGQFAQQFGLDQARAGEQAQYNQQALGLQAAGQGMLPPPTSGGGPTPTPRFQPRFGGVGAGSAGGRSGGITARRF